MSKTAQPAAEPAAAKKALSAAQLAARVASHSGLAPLQVKTVLASLATVTATELSGDGPGTITLPGLVRLTAKHKPAVPERDSINPFTKEPVRLKAKPATRVVKAAPVKALKDVLAG